MTSMRVMNHDPHLWYLRDLIKIIAGSSDQLDHGMDPKAMEGIKDDGMDPKAMEGIKDDGMDLKAMEGIKDDGDVSIPSSWNLCTINCWICD